MRKWELVLAQVYLGAVATFYQLFSQSLEGSEGRERKSSAGGRTFFKRQKW